MGQIPTDQTEQSPEGVLSETREELSKGLGEENIANNLPLELHLPPREEEFRRREIPLDNYDRLRDLQEIEWLNRPTEDIG